MNFWLGDPDAKFWGRGPLSLGALIRYRRVAPDAEKMVALSVAVTEKIAIEKFSLTPSSGETGGGAWPQIAHVGRGPRGVRSLKVSLISSAPFGRYSTPMNLNLALYEKSIAHAL